MTEYPDPLDSPTTAWHQLRDIYERMAIEAHYFPAAPSDGMGTITGDIHIEDEKTAYANDWEANKGVMVWIGYDRPGTRAATVFAVEAARNMCGYQDSVALSLLRMAVAELEALGVQASSDD